MESEVVDTRWPFGAFFIIFSEQLSPLRRVYRVPISVKHVGKLPPDDGLMRRIPYPLGRLLSTHTRRRDIFTRHNTVPWDVGHFVAALLSERLARTKNL